MLNLFTQGKCAEFLFTSKLPLNVRFSPPKDQFKKYFLFAKKFVPFGYIIKVYFITSICIKVIMRCA